MASSLFINLNVNYNIKEIFIPDPPPVFTSEMKMFDFK